MTGSRAEGVRTSTPPTPESDEGPNHAAWEQFAAVMESLADTMDDGPMVTNAAGVEFLDALARRGYEVRPHAAAIEAAVTARVLADVAARLPEALHREFWVRDMKHAPSGDMACWDMEAGATARILAHLTGGTDR